MDSGVPKKSSNFRILTGPIRGIMLRAMQASVWVTLIKESEKRGEYNAVLTI